ncbi:MAG: hypothetical protein PHW66_09380 [Gallionella sp.]|nr:hypothetical protein [Gallionella sp.]
MLVLGLAGAAGSGKSAVAEYLVQRYGFMRFSFSDFLYAQVAEAFGLESEDVLHDRATKEVATPLLAMENCADDEFDYVVRNMFAPEDHSARTPYSPRQILQWWGSDYRRAQNPNYWIDQAEQWLEAMYSFPQYPEHRCNLFVNDSVRFENERMWVKEMDGGIWHLRRDAAAPVAGHVSETPLPVLDGEREIFNNYTLDYLYKGVDQLLTSGAKFVRLEPPAPMVEPEPLPGGQYYAMQADGHNMLCNADGTRSIFDDVDE